MFCNKMMKQSKINKVNIYIALMYKNEKNS